MNWTAEKIKTLRKMYAEPQNDFTRRIGVTVDTLQHWEQGRGVPSGAAAKLLDRLEEDAREGKIRELV